MTVQQYTPPQMQPAQLRPLGQLPQLPFSLSWPALIAIVVAALLLWGLLGSRGKRERERRKQLRRARLKYEAESARIKAGV